VAKIFAPALSELAGPRRQHLLDGLHAISVWSFWESLRTELGLGPAQAEELVRLNFTALLAATGFPNLPLIAVLAIGIISGRQAEIHRLSHRLSGRGRTAELQLLGLDGPAEQSRVLEVVLAQPPGRLVALAR
jgi:hypothetical protein